MDASAMMVAEWPALPMDRSTWALIVLIVAVGYIYFKSKKVSRKDMPAAHPYSTLATQRRVEGQMTELLVELEKMSRQITAQLDTRAAKLEELIGQADERIANLKAATAGPRFAEGVEEIPEEAPETASYPIDPRHAAVYALADSGRSPMEISREVGQPAGEVELILALRRRAR